MSDKVERMVEVLQEVFTSPEMEDGDGRHYDGNIVDALDKVAHAMVFAAKHLGTGDACTTWGALEAHGKAILDAADNVSGALYAVAEALSERVNDGR